MNTTISQIHSIAYHPSARFRERTAAYQLAVTSGWGDDDLLTLLMCSGHEEHHEAERCVHTARTILDTLGLVGLSQALCIAPISS